MNSKSCLHLLYTRADNISPKHGSVLNTHSNDFIQNAWHHVSGTIASGVTVRGDGGVTGEGRIVGVPKFHSWGKCTMPLTNIKSDWMSNVSSVLCIILYYIILYEQSNCTPRCSRDVSAAGLPWLKHFRVQSYM